MEKENNSLYSQIIEAMQDSDLEKLDDLLVIANQKLTGKEQSHFASNSTDERRKILEDFLELSKDNDTCSSEPIYLGDAGLSRIVLFIFESEFGLELTSNSTSAVEQKWNSLICNNAE